MANRKRLVSIPGRSSIQGRRSTSHPRHSPKLGERPQYSARSLSRCSLRVFGTTFKNFKAEDQVNMNLDDLERLLRNLMLSLGHASEMLPPRSGHSTAQARSKEARCSLLTSVTMRTPPQRFLANWAGPSTAWTQYRQSGWQSWPCVSLSNKWRMIFSGALCA